MYITDALPDASTALPLQQHPGFARALWAMGVPAFPATLHTGARRIGHALMVKRRLAGLFGVGFMSQGPVWSDCARLADRIDGFAAFARDGLRLVNSCAGDDVALGGANYRRIMTPATVAEVDLSGGTDAQRNAMSVKWRNRLSRAERSGLRWQSMRYEPAADDWLLKLEARQRKLKRYKALPLDFTRAWAAANPRQSRLFVAYDGRERVAAMLFLTHGPVATYHIGWSGTLGREMWAHNFLLSHAMAWCADKGITRLDLGTIDTESSSGLARFKLGAGAKPVPLGGTWLNLRG